AELKRTVANPGHRNDFGIVSRRENLTRLLKILIGKGLLDYRHTAFTQKPNHPLASDTRQKCSIRRRCKHYAILGHKNVRGGELARRSQRRLVDRETPASGLGFMCLHPRPFFFRPIHGPDVKRDILIELFYPLTRETNPGFCRDRWLQEELRCRVIDTCAMEIKVGCNPLECPRTIKND